MNKTIYRGGGCIISSLFVRDGRGGGEPYVEFEKSARDADFSKMILKMRLPSMCDWSGRQRECV